jgi:hypothetical protein
MQKRHANRSVPNAGTRSRAARAAEDKTTVVAIVAPTTITPRATLVPAVTTNNMRQLGSRELVDRLSIQASLPDPRRFLHTAAPLHQSFLRARAAAP